MQPYNPVNLQFYKFTIIISKTPLLKNFPISQLFSIFTTLNLDKFVTSICKIPQLKLYKFISLQNAKTRISQFSQFSQNFAKLNDLTRLIDFQFLQLRNTKPTKCSLSVQRTTGTSVEDRNWKSGPREKSTERYSPSIGD